MIKPAPGYSSLFFPSVQQFPSGLLDGEDSFPVTFAIGNPAQQSRDYRWSIQTMDQGKIATIDSGTASVAAGSVNVVRQTVQASCSGKMKVIVRLTAPGEPDDAIDFLTTCTQDNSGRNVSTSAGGPSTGPAKSSSKGAGSTSGAAGL